MAELRLDPDTSIDQDDTGNVRFHQGGMAALTS